jgi:hypothetical protein
MPYPQDSAKENAMNRWIPVFLILGSLLLFSGGNVFAAGATIVRGNGCGVPDANHTLYFIADCSLQFVFTSAGGYLVHGHATLPAGAVLPAKAFSVTVEELGFSGCLNIGDRSKITVTPSGQVNFSCHGP